MIELLCPYDECRYRADEYLCMENYINCPDFLVWHSDLMTKLKNERKKILLSTQEYYGNNNGGDEDASTRS